MKRNTRNILVPALLLCAVLFAGVTGVYALVPPPPPPPAVPQTVGLQDISINFLTTNGSYVNDTVNGQGACRQCHTSAGTNISGGYNNTNQGIGGVDTRHHGLVQRAATNPYTGVPFQCTDCHPTITGNGILLDHSCQDCHNGTNFWADNKANNPILKANASVGNFSRPHHINTSYTEVVGFGNPAADRHCKVCHGSFVDSYDDQHYVPSYATSFMITPFASFKATNTSQLDLLNGMGGNIRGLTNLSNVSASPTGGYKVWGGCYSCHLSNYTATPQPIGSNHDNHHLDILGAGRIGGTGHQKDATPFNLSDPNTPGYNASLGYSTEPCFVCHVVTPTGGPLEINYTDGGTGITTTDHSGMEVRNSTVESTSLLEPFAGNTNITYNGTGCEKCHSVASIHNIQGSGGYVQNGPQGLGHINNNTDCYGCHNSWLPADTWTPGPVIPTMSTVSPSVITVNTATTVTITGMNFVNDVYTSAVSIDGGAPITPTSETGTQITVKIPALAAGAHTIQLVKGGTGGSLSKLSILTVTPNVKITSAKLGKGGVITITGSNFGTQPPTAQYVSVTHAGSVIFSTKINAWSTTSIKVTNSAAAKGDLVTVMTTNLGEASAQIN